MARSLSHPLLFEYINDRIRAAYKYFAIPQTEKGPLFDDIDPRVLQRQLQETMRLLQENSERSQSRDHSLEGSTARGQPDKSRPVKSETTRDKAQLKHTVSQSSTESDQSQKLSPGQNAAKEADDGDEVDSAVKLLDALKVSSDDITLKKPTNSETHTPNLPCDDEIAVKPSTSSLEEIAAALLDSVIRNSIRRYREEVEATQDNQVNGPKAVEDKDSGEKPERSIEGQDKAEVKKTEESSSSSEDGDDVVIEEEESEDETDEVKRENTAASQERPRVANGDVRGKGLVDGSTVSVITAEDLVFKFDESTLTDAQVKSELLFGEI